MIFYSYIYAVFQRIDACLASGAYTADKAHLIIKIRLILFYLFDLSRKLRRPNAQGKFLSVLLAASADAGLVLLKAVRT